MAINVTCPSCLKRFTVADQHAGKTGPCPACKKPIKIPEADEAVVIHAPKPDGPVDKEGKEVLKTVKRSDAAFDPLVATGVAVTVLLTLLAAFLLRGNEELANSWAILGGGSVLLGPLVAWSGYSFLRDQELEPFRGGELWLRALIAGVALAICWFVYHVIAGQLGVTEWRTEGLEMWQAVIASAVAVGIGTFAAFASLDLDPAIGFLLAAFYFVLTIGLRVVMALPALPGLISEG